MRNNSCIICQTEFPPREGKLYCSNACKQKGFADRKIMALENKNFEVKKAEEKKGKQFTIYFPEYQEYRMKYNNQLSDFTLFCFFRKNWIGVWDVKKFHSSISGNDDYFWEEFWSGDRNGNVSPARKKYNEFQEKYYGGEEIKVEFDGKEQ